jgi:hypothetical protein
MLEGSAKTRILGALGAGLVATLIVILAAAIGPKLLDFMNLNIVKIFCGIAVGIIALMISGIKLPDNLPLVIIGIGVIAGIIWR